MQALFSTMRFEPQPMRQDKSARPAADVVKLESESASPPTSSEIQSKTNTCSRTKHDIDGDIRRLEEVFFNGHPMQSGFIIETSLQDLLIVCPRKRRLKDAFKSLTSALSKMGVSLIIKTKKGEKKLI